MMTCGLVKSLQRIIDVVWITSHFHCCRDKVVSMHTMHSQSMCIVCQSTKDLISQSIKQSRYLIIGNMFRSSTECRHQQCHVVMQLMLTLINDAVYIMYYIDDTCSPGETQNQESFKGEI